MSTGCLVSASLAPRGFAHVACRRYPGQLWQLRIRGRPVMGQPGLFLQLATSTGLPQTEE